MLLNIIRGFEHTTQVGAQLSISGRPGPAYLREDTWSEGLWQNAASLVVKIS
jgi:hypothetical protein